MNYTASLTDYFKSRHWLMNTLLGGLCILIPLVGPIVIMGWLVTGFWARSDENLETFPAFDFSKFGIYLERGIWSFLVAFAASLMLMPIMFLVMISVFLTAGLFAQSDGQNNWIGILVPVLIVLLYLVGISMVSLLVAPLKLRASLQQDFVKAFNVAFIRRFIALTWKEILLSSLFMMIVGIALSMAGALLFCIGMYFAAVPIYFVWTHLNTQIYLLYLKRGGEPVPRDPKLNDDPPPLPAV